jgi:hypothetical protein
MRREKGQDHILAVCCLWRPYSQPYRPAPR